MKNVSHFTKDGYIKMHKVMGGKIITQTIILNIIALLIGVVFIIRKQYALGVVSFIVMIFFSIAIPLNRHIKIKNLVNSSNDLFDKATYEFSFGDDEYTSHYTCGEEVIDTSGKYIDFYKIIDTPEYVYLFINMGVAYIVDKKGFENEEDSKKFTNILKLKNPRYFYKN